MTLAQTFQTQLDETLKTITGRTDLAGKYTIYAVRAQSGPPNTRIRLETIPGNGSYDGSIVLEYSRLPLEQLATLITNCYHLSVSPDSTNTELFNELERMTGVLFTDSDVEVSWASNGDSVVTLTAKPDSKSFLGSITITFAPKPQVSTLFYSDTLVGF